MICQRVSHENEDRVREAHAIFESRFRKNLADFPSRNVRTAPSRRVIFFIEEPMTAGKERGRKANGIRGVWRVFLIMPFAA